MIYKTLFCISPLFFSYSLRLISPPALPNPKHFPSPISKLPPLLIPRIRSPSWAENGASSCLRRRMASTATQQGKSQPHGLHHNFSSPDMKPLRIQRLLKYDMAGGERRSAPARDSHCAPTPIGEAVDDGGLKELSKKLLNHLREAADKMKLGMPPINPPLLPPPPEMEAEKKGGDQADHFIARDAARPWNLRTRRTARRATASPAKTVRVRSEGSEKKKGRPRFSVSLSREEIEEDIFVLTGSRPRRRPKKRLRNVQWLLDAIFPGLWLSEITLELYKVAG